MGNQITIEPTEFINVRSGEKTFGFRLYDDYGQTYDNTWDSILDDDMEILKKVMKSDDAFVSDAISFIRENEKGIDIGGEWYDWEQIKHIIGEE